MRKEVIIWRRRLQVNLPHQQHQKFFETEDTVKLQKKRQVAHSLKEKSANNPEGGGISIMAYASFFKLFSSQMCKFSHSRAEPNRGSFKTLFRNLTLLCCLFNLSGTLVMLCIAPFYTGLAPVA